mmetsp:Transcript_36872/g.88056  ORF Transcript_36872/g.88056 Transcript_36872/m.88056 type:complete len:209 (+) Transcript_36872:112-738(+)
MPLLFPLLIFCCTFRCCTLNLPGFRFRAFFSPRRSAFILLSTVFTFAPLGTFFLSSLCPPPPFLMATLVTGRWSCLASLFTALRICRAFACSLMSDVSARAMAVERNFSSFLAMRFFLRALASATFLIGRLLISASRWRNWLNCSLLMGISGLLYLSSSSRNQTGNAGFGSKVYLLYPASKRSILDFLDSTSKDPMAKVSASSRGSDG